MTKSKLEKTIIPLDERQNYSRIKTVKRKVNTMPKESLAVRTARVRYQKTRVEHSKDIVIAILITAIVTFIVSGNI